VVRIYDELFARESSMSICENSKKQFEAEYVSALLESIDEICRLFHVNGRNLP
jgi:HD-GYP domain-containing protein (c-di-GMP phosphodiesterase class II)